jgi:predicted nucleic acid-binding protein
VPLTRVIWANEELHRRALQRLFRTDRRGLSLVDCSSFVVMETKGIREALALDEEFSGEGFRLIPAIQR